MRKVNSQSKEKIWENTSISKLSVKFFSVKQKSMQFQNKGKVDFHHTGKVWENTNISNLLFS